MTSTLIFLSVLEAKRFCSAGQPADLPGADANQSPACQRCGTVSVVLWYACQCLGATSCTTAFCRDPLLPRRCPAAAGGMEKGFAGAGAFVVLYLVLVLVLALALALVHEVAGT